MKIIPQRYRILVEMLYPFHVIFDFIFPPTKHELLLRSVTPERFLTWYRHNCRAEIQFLSEYQLPEVQAAIAACKFEHSYHAANLLRTLLQAYLCTLPPKKTILIPIPLSAEREHARTFNQVSRVATALTTIPYPIRTINSLLVRTIDTTAQTSLSRSKRLTNVKGAFAVVEKNLFYLEGIERIIICDDVLTTGATLTTARQTLEKYIEKNIEVISVAWAH